MLLHPLGGAQQARLLTVPAGVNDAALGPPAGFPQRAQCLGFAHHRDFARQRVRGAEHPAIIMVAAHDPFVLLRRSGQRGDHVGNGLQRPFGLHLQMHLHAVVPAETIMERQAAAPVVGHGRALQAGEDLGRIGIGNRQCRDFEHRRRRLAGEALGVLGGTHTGGERIAGIGDHIQHAAALHPGRRAAAAVGVAVGRTITILLRIGIDQAADGALFLRQLRLQATPASAITRDDDLALHRNAAPRQRLVIGGQAIVHIDHRRRDIAITLKGDIGRQRTGEAVGGFILRYARLLPAQCLRHRADESQRRGDRRGIEHLIIGALHLPAPLLEHLFDQRGIGLVVRAAQVIGAGGHRLQPRHLIGAADLGIIGRFAIGGRLRSSRGAQQKRRQNQ